MDGWIPPGYLHHRKHRSECGLCVGYCKYTSPLSFADPPIYHLGYQTRGHRCSGLLTLYGKNFNNDSVGSRASTWLWIIAGAVVGATSLIVCRVTWMWLAVRQSNLPNETLRQPSTTLLQIWLVIRGIFSQRYSFFIPNRRDGPSPRT
jgi:hypothetical protein